MPPRSRYGSSGSHGQILSYPQKQWKKKRYQYLKFFMQPTNRRGFDPDAEMHTISQIENPSLNEDSNASLGKDEASKVVSVFRVVVINYEFHSMSLRQKACFHSVIQVSQGTCLC